MSHAPLDGLDRVLDVAADTAASVDRDARFPAGDGRRAGRVGPARLDAPGVARRSRWRPGRLPVDHAGDRVAMRLDRDDLRHARLRGQVTAAGTPGGDSPALRAMADGSNLSTLAFSERGSRSHFWAPVSQLEGSRLSAQKSFVTTAGQADSYVVSTRPDGRRRRSSRACTSA